MAKSVIGTIAGAVIGIVAGMTIAGMSYQLGDTSSVSYIGRGVITVLGFGFGAMAGAITGLANAMNRRVDDRHV